MGPKPTRHTIESLMARTHDFGYCKEWQGYFNGRSPCVKIDGKYVQVRRLIRSLYKLEIPEGHFVTVSCCNYRCVNPSHIMTKPEREFMKEIAEKVWHQDPIRNAKIRMARSHARIFTEKQAQAIRLDPRPSREVAAEYGCSKDLVNKIRSGKSYKPLTAASNPFTGLIR